MVLGVGWIGQSNMFAIADYGRLSSPPPPASLLALRYFNIDFYDSLDDAGIWRQLVIPPSGLTPVLSSYDYPPNYASPDVVVANGSFGPDVFAGLALAAQLGVDIYNVKAASGGLFLTKSPPTLTRFKTSWLWPSAHTSWDTTVPRSSTPYTATVRASGTATAVATEVVPPFVRVTDATATWTINEHQDRWVVIGGNFGRVLSNTATELIVEYLFPALFGALPVPGPYTLEQRDSTPASWAKAFIDGYCVGALAAEPTFDLQLVGIALGESDAMVQERAVVSKDAMLKLIWYVRTRAVANGVTSLPAHQIGVSLSLVKEIPEQPFAAIVNRGYREIAEADPFVRIVPVQDLPVGGYEVVEDPFHYNAEGQRTFGQRHGAAMLDLLSVSSTAPRKSLRYTRRHRVVKPLFGVPAAAPRRWVADASTLSQFSGLVDMPIAYADRDGEAEGKQLGLDPYGYSITSASRSPLWGYGLSRRGQTMFPVDDLQQAPVLQRRLSGGSSTQAQASGFVWPAGSRAGSGFDEIDLVSGVHVLGIARNCGRKITRWRTNGVDWLRRGYNGAMGVAVQLEVDEFTGDGTTLWMRHRIGEGDSSRAQTQGRGWSKMPPTDREGCMALEYGCDELAPYAFAPTSPLPALTADEIKLLHDHGGVSAAAEAVLWDAFVSSSVTPNWQGIAGCFRVVQTIRPSFAIGHSQDRLTLLQRVFVDHGLFTRPISYDPATTTLLPWTTVGNLTRTFTELDYEEMDASAVSVATGLGPFTDGSGVAAFEQVGGLVVGLYQSLRGSFETIRRPVSLTVSGLVAASPAVGFDPIDQLDYGYLAQTSTALGSTLREGTDHRWAMFILVGDLLTVQDAADELYALGADASWVD